MLGLFLVCVSYVLFVTKVRSHLLRAKLIREAFIHAVAQSHCLGSLLSRYSQGPRVAKLLKATTIVEVASPPKAVVLCWELCQGQPRAQSARCCCCSVPQVFKIGHQHRFYWSPPASSCPVWTCLCPLLHSAGSLDSAQYISQSLDSSFYFLNLYLWRGVGGGGDGGIPAQWKSFFLENFLPSSPCCSESGHLFYVYLTEENI